MNTIRTIHYSQIADAVRDLCIEACTQLPGSVRQLLNDARQQEPFPPARETLELTDQPVSQIAHVLAFSSQSHFISVFRQHVGMTPGEYRRRAPLTQTE